MSAMKSTPLPLTPMPNCLRYDVGRFRRFVLGAVSLGTAFFAVAEPLAGQVTTSPAATTRRARITGTVVDEASKQPIAGVNVFVVGTPVTGTTGPDGRYVIASAPVGIYSIDARKLGFGLNRKENI